MEFDRRNVGFLVLAGLILANIYIIGIYAPIERTMGVVQKVFYFHVGSAWIGMLAFVVVFICSILFLWRRSEEVNQVAVASAEIGVVFISCTLLTGPIWAYPIWNTWWTWDPRLTTTLVLWFMYVAYIALQGGGVSDSRRRFAAVYGIIAFVNVPLVFYSARWWRSIHPVVVTSEGMNLDPRMKTALFASIITFSALYAYLMGMRLRVLRLRKRIEALKENLVY